MATLEKQPRQQQCQVSAVLGEPVVILVLGEAGVTPAPQASASPEACVTQDHAGGTDLGAWVGSRQWS